MSDSTGSDEMSLKEVVLKVQEWWRFLLSKWIIILAAGLVGGGIGIAYAWLQKPTYTAELSFTVQGDKSSSRLGGAMGLASQFGIDVGGTSSGGEFSGDNLLALMRSRSMVEKALLTPAIVNGRKKILVEYYIDINNIRKSWKGKPEENIHFEEDRSKFTLKQDSILGLFYKQIITNNLSVDKLDKKLSIILVKVNSIDQLFSKFFTEALAKVVSDFYIQSTTKKEAQTVAVLQRQTDSVRNALNSAISGVAQNADVNPNPNPLLQTLRVPSQRKQVDVQANTVILNQLVANLELSKLSLLQVTPFIQVIDKPILPLNKEGFGKKKGLMLGGIFGVFAMAIFLLIKHNAKKIMDQ